MAFVSAGVAAMPIGLLHTPPQDSMLVLAVTVSAAVVGVGYGLLWLRGWPTRIQSLSMIACGGVVTMGTLFAAEPVIALISCSGLVVLCGYLAFFHSPRSVVFSILVSVVVSALCAHRAAEALPGSSVAVTGFWVVVEVTVVVPIAIVAVVRTLGVDVVRSHHDALTGVLNRRAFYERASSMLTSRGSDEHVVVVMVDLDRFKLFNDTNGHVAGDQILTAVGWALRGASGGTAIIGRVGGDEFLVLDCLPPEGSQALPQRVCAAIAALPHRVTASVGAAIVPLTAVIDPARTIGELVRVADAAMYQAKRDGGNRAVASVTETGRL
ncbi:GGDEF domain-containing protein [Mycolicibacterium sp. S2-37]|uniref:GGDEF domain-containing protein n=1 Tax=Mycolicibacterium sp. S2-37 TaxID=2810297 RepID=UPI0027DA21E3|nr:GGDEF domain-containing protein [Mycolicibacterium sp. S2-37]